MAEVKKLDFSGTDHILDEEDEATLAAIDRGIKDADEGRLVPAEEVRKRMKNGLQSLLHPIPDAAGGEIHASECSC